MNPDEFTCLFANRLEQFGTVSMTLIVTHKGGIVPVQRTEKNFHTVDPDTVDALFLDAVAAIEVKRIVAEWNAENPI